MTIHEAAPIARSNIVQLPTAASRVIKNPTRAAREYRREQPAWPRREARPDLTGALAIGRSPELLIALCVLKALSPEQRRTAQDAVHATAFVSGDDTARLASFLVAQVGGTV